MNLHPDHHLLHYRLISKIGEGGMGVVWRAEDTQLHREVALKLLPESFAADPERLARFEREARLLASLNHPCIAAVYGLHECDTETGSMRFLAMELVEGEDLSIRLSRGALPVDDALELAGRVCEALEAAHEAGVVHRDLKPANVMLTPEGKVKVLDFGLAKALVGAPASGSATGASLPRTMTSAGTQAGVILGTAAYMSPEQARGKPVDRRTDVWALGCLLYEMLTGRSAFRGETVTDTLAAVVRADPDWDALPPGTPPTIRRMLRRSLEKNPARRLRDAGDLRLEIDEASSDANSTDELETTTLPPAATAGSRSGGLLWAIGGALLATLVLIGAWAWMAPPPEDPGGSVRFEVVGATGESFISAWSLAVSPDGRRIAWAVSDRGQRAIWLREIDALEARRLPDTDGASRPTFSPDGQSIAFYAQGKLRRFDLGSRRAIDLCDAGEGAGITWGRDGMILFNDGWINPLHRVSSEGGPSEQATRLDEDYGEIGHWFPQLLPDGDHVLISRWRTELNDMTVAVVSLDSGEIRDLLPRASYARYVPTGGLLFTRAGAIHVVSFDAENLQVSGDPVLLVDGIEQQWDNGGSPWNVSASGTLAYMPGGLWTTRREIVRVSRRGAVEPVDLEPGAYVHVAMSPDGKRLAVTEFESGRANVRIHDLARGVDTQVPLDAVNAYAVWSPDGSEILFDTAQDGPWDIYRYPIDGSSPPEPLLADRPDQIPLAWSPDGRFIVWSDNYAEIRSMDLAGERKPKVLLPIESEGVSISPDGRWLAYGASITGQQEVLVRRFPDGTRDYQVSIDGGGYPLWSRDGRELLYRRGPSVFAATIRVAGDELVADRPRELFRDDSLLTPNRHVWSHDPTTDELIMIRSGEHEVSRDRFVVWLGWPGELGGRQ